MPPPFKLKSPVQSRTRPHAETETHDVARASPHNASCALTPPRADEANRGSFGRDRVATYQRWLLAGLDGEQFYESDKSTYLADMAEEQPYWDALSTIRRQMMEIFLLMGDDYVGHPEIGKACHKRRMNFERSLIESGHEAQLATLYRSLAQAGMGRTCGTLAQKR